MISKCNNIIVLNKPLQPNNFKSKIIGKINNFQSILKRTTVGESLTSNEPFELANFPSDTTSKWIIIFYPKGQYEFGYANGKSCFYLKLISSNNADILTFNIRFGIKSSQLFGVGTTQKKKSKFILNNIHNHWAGPFEILSPINYKNIDNLIITCEFECEHPSITTVTTSSMSKVDAKETTTKLSSPSENEINKSGTPVKRKGTFSDEERAEIRKKIFSSSLCSDEITTKSPIMKNLIFSDKESAEIKNNDLFGLKNRRKALTLSDISSNHPNMDSDHQQTSTSGKDEMKRAWPPGDINRPIKRLFTPEIKRMLKDWLVRRRENPYPSREEKKALAIKTGLTYIQICNWFANWRRKLKNAGREPQKKTWGHLIKNYNTSANGNVEQFSICSSDSIWGDEERTNAMMYDFESTSEYYRNSMDYNCNEFDDLQRQSSVNNGKESVDRDFKEYYPSVSDIRTEIVVKRHPGAFSKEQCFQVSSTTNSPSCIKTNATDKVKPTTGLFSNAKYKSHIMEKYLRGLDCASTNNGGVELSKWLESAANFQPNKNNYIEWESNRNKSSKSKQQLLVDANSHEKEELEAAEALTSLAGNYRNRMIEHS